MRPKHGLIAASIITALVTAGCGSPGSSTAAAAPPSAAGSASAPSAPPSSPPDCMTRFTDWRDGGGLSDLTAVQDDLGTLSSALSAMSGDMNAGADLSADEASVQQAAASLQSDAQTAQADLPPSCAPGVRRNVSAAMTDYSRAAIDCNQAVTEASSGNMSIAVSDIYAGSHAMAAGNGKVAKATKAIRAFNGG